MKKLLALVLALVMTLGLATVSTSAAYTDANDIDYSEAVDVMTAVGVFQGKGNAFAPKDGLNRAEAAKLIAYLMLGNKTAESMKGSGTRFTDIPASHWAAGYIEYLASVGVVSGVGGGQFNPNGQVTAVQFAKMLLVALGYDAELENFVGEGWSINIQKVANENDLFKGLDISANDALTREQAAQMCLNDLKADMVEYSDKGTTVKIGESTVVTGAKKADKKTTSNDKGKAIDDDKDGAAYILNLGEDLYNGDLTLKKDGTDDMGRPANKWKYKTADVGTYAALDDMIFEAQDEVKQTKVYEVLGKTVFDDFKGTKSANNEKDKGSVHWKVWVDGYDMTAYFDYDDLMNKDSTYAIGTGDNSKATDGTVANLGTRYTGNGSTTQIFLQEDEENGANGKVDLYTFVITNEYLVQATADYGSSRESVNVKTITDDNLPWSSTAVDADNNAGTKDDLVTPCALPTTIDQEDFDVSGVKKDDYLVVTYSSSKDSFQTVKPATMLEGEITKYVANDTVTIDGTLYKYAKKVEADHKATSYTVGNKVVMVTDGKYILAVDDANATKDYVYLQDVGKSTGTSSNVAVALYGTDGTLRDVKVKKLTDKKDKEYNGKQLDAIANGPATTEANLYGWYTYSTDDSGIYTLKAVDKTTLKNTNYTYTTVDYDLNTLNEFKAVDNEKVSFLKSNVSATESIKANNKTVFILLDDDDDITVYTGLANAPTVTVTGAKVATETAYISYVNDDGYASYVFIDLSNTNTTAVKTVSIDDSTLSDDYIMVVKSNANKTNYDNKDNSNAYYTNTVLFDGAITSKDFEKDTDATLGILYHKIKTNNKGYITGLTSVTTESNEDYAIGVGLKTAGAADKYAVSFKNGTVTIGNQGYLLNTDNCINLVLGKGVNPAKDKNADYTEYLGIGGAALESYLKNQSYTYNYFGVRHDDNSNTLDALYVWVGADATSTDADDIEGTLTKGVYATAGNIELDADTTINSDVTLTVNGNLKLTNANLVINGGIVNVTGALTGNGNITLQNGGKLYVDGALTLTGTGGITITGCELTVGKATKVTGDVVIASDNAKDPAKITFGDSVTFKGNVKLGANSNVSVTKKATFEKGATIENGAAVEFKDAVDATGKDITITGSNVTFKGTVAAKDVTVTKSDVTVEATVTASGAVTVDKDSAVVLDATVTATNGFEVAEGADVSGTKAEAAKALTAAKEEALAKITALATLKNNEYDVVKTDLTSLKAAADKAVNDATTVEAVAKVMAKDKETDAYTGDAMKALETAVKAYETKVALAAAKAAALKEINALAEVKSDYDGSLTTQITAVTEAANAAKAAVNNATTAEAVATVMAKNKDTGAYTADGVMDTLKKAVDAYDLAVAIKVGEAAIDAEAKKHDTNDAITTVVSAQKTAIAAQENDTVEKVEAATKKAVAAVAEVGNAVAAVKTAKNKNNGTTVEIDKGELTTSSNGEAIKARANDIIAELISTEGVTFTVENATEATQADGDIYKSTATIKASAGYGEDGKIESTFTVTVRFDTSAA